MKRQGEEPGEVNEWDRDEGKEMVRGGGEVEKEDEEIEKEQMRSKEEE